MAIQIQGNGGTVSEVEAAFRSNRVTIYPQDPGTLGVYAAAADNGATQMTAGLAAAAPIFSFRWGSTNVALIRSVKMTAVVGATGFTAGRFIFDLIAARSFTVSDSVGTAVTLTGNNSKKRTSFGTSLVTDMRIANTVTLTAGTRTLDATPIARIHGWIPVTAGVNMIPTPTVLWQRDSSDEYPLVLAQNEGFIIAATVPATGVWFFSVNIEWMELASY